MPRTRQELEQLEAQTLAPYAQLSGSSRGRKFKESQSPWRTEYQRDRDRVIHARAFRRLEYKTQVFLNCTGDDLRTLLTHTMEVAAIARGIARALRLNEDLTETIALAHDLGHSPFGHRGEHVLDRLMKNHGGFEHNRQSLRVVEELEQKYSGFPGLNLSWEVREGLVKHFTAYDHPSKRKGFDAKNSSLEAQVANLADEITYYSHDLDDGLDARLLSEDELNRNVTVWRNAARKVKKEQGNMPEECRRYAIIREMIDGQVRDVVETTEKLIAAAGVRSADAVRLHRTALVQYSASRRRLNREMRKYLYRNLYFSKQVDEANTRAVRILAEVFNFYLKHPKELGEQSQKRIRREGLHRAVCDYIAGMTDRYVMHEYQRHFGLGYLSAT